MLFTQAIRHHYEYYRERPFGRLVRLFVARIFSGAVDSDADGLDLGIGVVLTLLALPGGFVSILLFNQYGSLLQWMRGQGNVDTLQIAMPDEYFFIVLSMTVTGAVAVWRWDAIFPDRRDYINLVPLPISIRTIFFANLVAILFLVAVLAVDVNAASCLLFPLVVSAAQTQFLFFLKFAVVHALGVISASIFAYLAVFATLGLLMAALPARAFRRVSTYVRGAAVIYLVAMLSTSFALPELLRHAKGSAPWWAFLMPSSWFVSLCQSLRGRANPAMTQLAHLCVPAFSGLAVVALCTYAIGYRRHFVRVAEIADSSSIVRQPHWPSVAAFLDRHLLRTPFQKAGFRFVRNTLLRSESHRLVLSAVAGLALVLVSQALMGAFEGGKSFPEAALSADALSIPFIFVFLIVVGLRAVFEIPTDLRANWIFQILLDADGKECAPLARKVMLPAAPLLGAAVFAAYAYLAGFLIASLHTLFVIAWSVLLVNLSLIRFRKLPFTCTPPVFKQHSIVILLALGFGYLMYAVWMPEFEASCLAQPARMAGFLPIMAFAWYVPHHLAKNTIELERKLIFEESATQAVQGLSLSE